MTKTLDDIFFALVRQSDRRQVPDRRQVLRGGRRASDAAANAIVGQEMWVLGSGSAGDRQVASAKPVRH